MADEKELESLAKRYLDVWESQLAGMAADSELAAQLGRLFAATNSALLAGLKQPLAAAGAAHAGQSSTDNTAPAPGSTAAAAAPGHGGLDLGELSERLAALERRLERLERSLERLAGES
jgi:TolA-binding protein